MSKRYAWCAVETTDPSFLLSRLWGSVTELNVCPRHGVFVQAEGGRGLQRREPREGDYACRFAPRNVIGRAVVNRFPKPQPSALACRPLWALRRFPDGTDQECLGFRKDRF